MGFAVATAAVTAGAHVRLVAGPVALSTPAGVDRIDVRSARQMQEAVIAAAAESDIFISAAAVGDYRPQTVSASKLKKSGQPLALELVQNPDILSDVSRLPKRPFLVGFAAETEALEHYARDKLERKGLDMIAANQVGAGFGFECAENAITLLWRDGREELGQASKNDLATTLIERIAARFHARTLARGTDGSD
jgi:phosphopantothenoylcysteine decarboxylase/phosphopantothenate--cysteine ligase